MIDWFKQINIYCERTDFSLWSEPLNFLSNAGFFLASYAAYQKAKSQNCLHEPFVLCAIILSALIGVGSGLFHSLATLWAQGADILGIGVYVLCFLAFWNLKALQLNRTQLGLSFLGLIVTTAGFVALLEPMLGESSAYLGILCYLVFLGIKERQLPAKQSYLLKASVIFAISIVFRTIDLAICDHVPMGTHFIWHGLNALVIFLSLSSLLSQYQNNSSDYKPSQGK